MLHLSSYTTSYPEQIYQVETHLTNLTERRPDKINSISIGVRNISNFQHELNSRHLAALKNMEELTDNWDNELAIAPSQNVIRKVTAFIDIMNRIGQNVWTVAPGPSGEIMVDLRSDDRSLEILFYEDKSKFVTFSPIEIPTQGGFEENDLQELLYWLNTERLNAS